MADQWVTLPDGTRLATDCYCPPRPAPVVLRRTPYSRRTLCDEALLWVDLGYAFVAQDVRGRGDSDGTWAPCQHEDADGEGTLRWLADQPWCDGRVIAGGWSYEAYAALELPDHPALVGRVLGFPFPGLHDLRYGPGRVFRVGHDLWWWLNHGSGRTSRPGFAEAMLDREPTVFLGPVSRLPHRLWGQLGAWPTPETPLHPTTFVKSRVPQLILTGWYDVFVDEALRLWEASPSGSALVVGCWTSALNQPVREQCARDFGPAADLALGDLQVAWLDALLGNTTGAPPAVQTFLIGTHRWVSGERWPPEPVGAGRLFLGADGALGSLVRGSRDFWSDPANPSPTPLPADDLAQRELRGDLLTFLSQPLPAPLRWYGSPCLEVVGESAAPSVDWVARLAYCEPDGGTFLLGEALVEDTNATATSHCLTVVFPPQAVELPAGSRLLVEVGGSSYPRYSVNPLTGQSRLTAQHGRPARQTLVCGVGGSHLTLPIARGSPWTPP